MSDEQIQPSGSEGASQASAPAMSATESLRANAANLFGGSSNASKSASTNGASRGESQSINPKFNQQSKGSEQDQLPESEENTNATNLEADSNKQVQGQAAQPKQFQTKGDKRFQQMANEIRDLKAIISKQGTASAATPAEGAQKSEVPALIPKPNKPGFSKDQLDKAEAIARQNGDTALLNSVAEEREKLRQYELDERFWKLENEKAITKYNEVQNHYIQEAVKKWPAVAQSDSPHYQMFERLANRVPELLNRSQGDGHYLLAEVAATYLKNKELESKLAALETKSQQTETENSGLKKRIAPAVQNKSLNVGSTPNGKKLSANDELRQRMAALQEAGQLGR